jgi:Tfp pilus assembly protein PilO
MPLSGENAMNLNRIPKEKRNQLVLIVLVTMMAMAGLGFGLVRGQFQSLAGLAAQESVAQAKLQRMKDTLRQTQQIQEEMVAANQKLCDFETDMASGDVYSWVINTVRRFKTDYKVEIPQYSPISAITEVKLLPHFPYKQATLTVSGTARYYDLGRFLADFENQFPHIRLLNFSVESNPGAAAEDGEKLTFKMDIVTLVKSNPT